jgi:biofilm PGA synthesis protein PgaD
MAQRTVLLSLTAFFWILWLYLITPLLSLVLWLVGYELFVDEMLVRGGYQALLRELRHYGLVVLGILLTILAWVAWNVHRYGFHNRRTQAPDPLLPAETADRAGLTAKELAVLQEARELTVDFDANDHLIMRRARP